MHLCLCILYLSAHSLPDFLIPISHIYTLLGEVCSLEECLMFLTNVICTLQLNPGDSVMDVRQFLLDAPETCFFTCYDLLLHAKDGAVHHLEDYNEISEVADITSGDCSLEMVAGNFLFFC